MIDHLRSVQPCSALSESIDTVQPVLNFDAGVDTDTNAWTN